MCIDARDSTTNYLSSGFFEDGAGNDQTFESEKNVLLSLSLSSWTFFDESHASLRAHRSCCKVSSCVYPRILEFQDFAREVHTSEHILAMDPLFPQLFTWRSEPLEKRTLRFHPKNFVLFPKIDLDFGGSKKPGIRNHPFASHDSMSQQILFHHFSLGFCWADCQPQCA